MDASDISEVYDLLRADYPGASIQASTFDAFTAELLKALPQLGLPVVTGASGLCGLSCEELVRALPQLGLPMFGALSGCSACCMQLCSALATCCACCMYSPV